LKIYYEQVVVKLIPDRTDDAAIDRLRMFEVRGQAAVLESDLVAIDGVATKVFNQAIKRNVTRFPADFLLRLTAEEWTRVRCLHSCQQAVAHRVERSQRTEPRAGAGAAFQIKFAEPVRGPLVFGYGAQFGLGLFVPAAQTAIER
jgi:CRISPR-associated protein Csb2